MSTKERVKRFSMSAAVTLIACASLLSPAAFAAGTKFFSGHIGVDIRDGSFVIGRFYKLGGPTGIPQFEDFHKVFSVDLAYDDALGYWITSNPGYAGFWNFKDNPLDLVGAKVGIAFLDGLWKWDGAIFSPTASERLRVVNPNGPGFTESGAGYVSPGFWMTIPSNNWLHEHVPARLISTGSDINSPADGIYLALLRIEMQDGSTGPSDPYAIVLNKGLSDADLVAADYWVKTNVVPEPASLSVLAAGLTGLAALRRRSRS